MKKIIFKKTNILLFLLIVTLILLMIVVLKTRVTSVKESIPQKNNPERVIINKEEYKKNIFSILSEYERIIQVAGIYASSTEISFKSGDPIFKQIDDLKNEIINVKAPSVEYKDLHMNLVMSLLSIKDYLEIPVNKKNTTCISSIEKVKKSQALLLD